MTCDDTTDVCPGSTKLACTCSVSNTSAGFIWTLPGSEYISLDTKVGSNSATTNDIFFAVVTNNTGGVLESMLIYNVTESLVNGTIECAEQSGMGRSVSATITYIFAG